MSCKGFFLINITLVSVKILNAFEQHEFWGATNQISKKSTNKIFENICIELLLCLAHRHNTAPVLCEESLTFNLKGLVISGLFLECSDIQMVTVKGVGQNFGCL